MTRLIDADALMDTLRKDFTEEENDNHFLAEDWWWAATVRKTIENAPTVDAVPVKGVEQLKWERDTAIQQLEEHGIPFCGKAEDVVRVVRCKDCKFYSRCTDHQGICTNRYMDGFIVPDWYCADGERKDDEAD